MAHVTIVSKTQTSVTVRIDGLSYPVNEYGAFRVKIGTGGSWTMISAIGTGYSSPSATLSGLSPGTSYTVYAEAFHGIVWWDTVTPASFTTDSAPPAPVRPSNWSWWYAKNSGGNFNITASEWNAFTAKINEFRSFKGLYPYGFTPANSMSDYYPFYFNQARNAIGDISSSVPNLKYSGDIIYASDLNWLVSSLNSVY